jgi:hypothetical protein
MDVGFIVRIGFSINAKLNERKDKRDRCRREAENQSILREPGS